MGHAPLGRSRGNARNGKSRKRVQSAAGDLRIETPRDREGCFDPQLVKKRQVRLAGMEEKILALYARGMTTRDIETALVDLYGVEISHTLIAQVTDAVHAVFPKTLMQLCIVHLVSASLALRHRGRQQGGGGGAQAHLSVGDDAGSGGGTGTPSSRSSSSCRRSARWSTPPTRSSR